MLDNSPETAAQTYLTALLDPVTGASCRAYLAERGIDPAGTCPRGSVGEVYGLGFVAEPALPGHDGFVGRLSVAYRTRAGVRGFKFRAIDGSEPKYLAPAGQRPRLYNVNDLLTAGDVVAICEGELDTVVMSAVVGVPAVGVAGVGMWRDHLPRVFAGFDRVLVVVDNDVKEDGRNPGRELGERIAHDLDRAVVIEPPRGSDLSEWVLAEGPAAVRQACGLEDDKTRETP